MTSQSQKHNALAGVFPWVRRNYPWLLILLALLGFCDKALYNYPIGLMALIGLYRAARHPRTVFGDPLIRAYAALFACLWLPMLLAFPDAVNKAHTAQTVFPYLRFLFMGIFVLQELRDPRQQEKLLAGVFVLISFWSLDAMLQYFTGYDVFGYPYREGDITGMFYPKNTISHILAVTLPVYLETLRGYSKRRAWLWLLLIPVCAVILLSGRRTAWILAFIGVPVYCLFAVRQLGRRVLRGGVLLAGIIAIALTLLVLNTESLQRRLEVTAGLFSLDYERIDRATARRLPLWETGLSMFQDNWINGIGPRGYRHVYERYAGPENYWARGEKTGQTHPHLHVLEVAVESGAIGLAGLGLFFVFLFRAFPPTRLPLPAAAWLSCLLAAVFPFNALMAFYGSYWSSVIWWLLPLGLVFYATTYSTQSRENTDPQIRRAG